MFSHKILQFALPLVTYTKSLNHFKAGKDVLLVFFPAIKFCRMNDIL